MIKKSIQAVTFAACMFTVGLVEAGPVVIARAPVVVRAPVVTYRAPAPTVKPVVAPKPVSTYKAPAVAPVSTSKSTSSSSSSWMPLWLTALFVASADEEELENCEIEKEKGTYEIDCD